jgi:hypothetical protein
MTNTSEAAAAAKRIISVSVLKRALGVLSFKLLAFDVRICQREIEDIFILSFKQLCVSKYFSIYLLVYHKMAEKELFLEIRAIRSLMERSTRFLSLSGLSGVLAGIYGLIGAGFSYRLLSWDKLSNTGLHYTWNLRMRLFLIGLSVLIFSVGTSIGLTKRNSNRKGLAAWNRSSQLLIKNAALPLFTGGCFALLLLTQGLFAMISPVCLCFYGLALVSASHYTYHDVKWLGVTEIGLGLLSVPLPAFGLLLWAIGFGVLHLVFGTIIHCKYDRS